ncbi:hypothetical protein GCM10010510_16980 [Streptomyces anandii JCM 4720]|nr:hypothetical protein GCM10010510_16980 [Streptomyces anandii JCM 4720]
MLERTPPGRGGEVQPTGTLRELASGGTVHGVVFDGPRHATGDKADYLRTVVRPAGNPATAQRRRPLRPRPPQPPEPPARAAMDRARAGTDRGRAGTDRGRAAVGRGRAAVGRRGRRGLFPFSRWGAGSKGPSSRR